MNDSTTFQLIGARGLFESVYVFFLFGVIAIVLGNSFSDLSHDLSKRFEDTLKEPISMNLFSVLTFPSLLLLALLGYWKGEEIIKTWQIDWLFLPFFRVGIAIGGGITGMLLGLGTSLWMNTHTSELLETACIFMQLGCWFFLLTSTLTLLAWWVVVPMEKSKLLLKILSAMLIILSIFFIAFFNATAAIKIALAEATTLFLFSVFLKYRKANKNYKNGN